MAKWGEIRCPRCAELEAKMAQQDDLVQAAVAAKLKEVAMRVDAGRHLGTNSLGHAKIVPLCGDDILALITEGAQAALDRVVAARFGTVRSEVVRLSAEGKMDNETTERLLAAIRAQGET